DVVGEGVAEIAQVADADVVQLDHVYRVAAVLSPLLRVMERRQAVYGHARDLVLAWPIDLVSAPHRLHVAVAFVAVADGDQVCVELEPWADGGRVGVGHDRGGPAAEAKAALSKPGHGTVA